MGDLIVLAERAADRSRSTATPQAAFFFDLACPFSYLAADQLERTGGDISWIPVLGDALCGDGWDAQLRLRAEALAARLRVPLVWPEGDGGSVRSMQRAAAYAGEVGAGCRFGLAASRLAFCGGFDLGDPEVITEAAAAAGIGLGRCLDAARDSARDALLEATTHGLRARGVSELPVVRVGSTLLQGEAAVTEAASLVRWRTLAGAPLAPAG